MKLLKEETQKARKTLRDKAIKRATDEKTSERIIKQLDALDALTGREALTLEMQLDIFEEEN